MNKYTIIFIVGLIFSTTSAQASVGIGIYKYDSYWGDCHIRLTDTLCINFLSVSGEGELNYGPEGSDPTTDGPGNRPYAPRFPGGNLRSIFDGGYYSDNRVAEDTFERMNANLDRRLNDLDIKFNELVAQESEYLNNSVTKIDDQIHRVDLNADEILGLEAVMNFEFSQIANMSPVTDLFQSLDDAVASSLREFAPSYTSPELKAFLWSRPTNNKLVKAFQGMVQEDSDTGLLMKIKREFTKNYFVFKEAQKALDKAKVEGRDHPTLSADPHLALLQLYEACQYYASTGAFKNPSEETPDWVHNPELRQEYFENMMNSSFRLRWSLSGYGDGFYTVLWDEAEGTVTFIHNLVTNPIELVEAIFDVVTNFSPSEFANELENATKLYWNTVNNGSAYENWEATGKLHAKLFVYFLEVYGGTIKPDAKKKLAKYAKNQMSKSFRRRTIAYAKIIQSYVNDFKRYPKILGIYLDSRFSNKAMRLIAREFRNANLSRDAMRGIERIIGPSTAFVERISRKLDMIPGLKLFLEKTKGVVIDVEKASKRVDEKHLQLKADALLLRMGNKIITTIPETMDLSKDLYKLPGLPDKIQIVSVPKGSILVYDFVYDAQKNNNAIPVYESSNVQTIVNEIAYP